MTAHFWRIVSLDDYGPSEEKTSDVSRSTRGYALAVEAGRYLRCPETHRRAAPPEVFERVQHHSAGFHSGTSCPT
jgi:hypothetical protein